MASTPAGQTTIPLNKLILSPRNVRRTNGEEDIESLADSIASKGLLQNLVVSESDNGKLYEVDAGGRRYRALQLLVERRALARNWPVPCLVIPREDATEASLAENLQKIAMNPADEVEAFAAIVERYAEGGMTSPAEQVANCARRFGVTERYVRQRLALAALAPEILDALRAGTIGLEAARAYATHPDHKLQLQVFKAEEKKQEGWRHSAKSIRDQLAGKVYPSDHPAVLYVGRDKYLANGGRIALDLFMGAEEEREVLLDTALLDKLCREKTSQDAQLLAQEDGWAGGVVKPWTGSTWIEAKAPDGYVRRYGDPAKLEEPERTGRILAYRIADDGSTLEPLTYCFELPEERRPAITGYTPETEEQRAARERAYEVEQIALRLATPSIAGTPLQDRAFWPARGSRWVEAVEQDPDGTYVVAMLVRIPAADVEAARTAAEAQYERELQELREENEAEPSSPASDNALAPEEVAA